MLNNLIELYKKIYDHQEIHENILRMSRGLEKLNSDEINCLVVDGPRFSGKTEFLCNFYVALYLAINKNKNVLLINGSMVRAVDTQREIMRNISSGYFNCEIDHEKTRRDHLYTTNNNMVLPKGFGSAICGYGSDLIILDELHEIDTDIKHIKYQETCSYILNRAFTNCKFIITICSNSPITIGSFILNNMIMPDKKNKIEIVSLVESII